MAERKAGPVKPPTIDLTARPVDDAAPMSAGKSTRPPRRAVKAAPEAVEPETVRLDASEPAVTLEPEVTPEATITPEAAPNPPAKPEPADKGTPPPPPIPPRPDSPKPKGDEPPVRPAARPATPQQGWGSILTAAALGALGGTILVYILAMVVPPHSAPPPFADPTPVLSAQEERLSALEASNAATAAQVQRTQVSLDATIAQLDAGLTDLRKSIAEQGAAIPEAPDLSAFENQLKTVSSRLDAIAAGASSADADALAQSLTGLQDTATGLGRRLRALEQQRSDTETALSGLRDDLAGLKESLDARPAAAEPVAPELGTAAADLEAAIAAGRPFTAELRAAAAAAPSLDVPAPLEARAGQGLPASEALAARFAARIPDMLAAGGAAPGDDWQQGALDWIKGVLAVRPAEEVEGDDPAAVVSRLEAAMARHDFTEAARLFDRLPAPMRAAAGDVADDTARLAEARAFVTALRTRATGAAQ